MAVICMRILLSNRAIFRDHICGNAANPGRCEQLSRGRHRAVDIDAAAGILDHDRLETFATRIFRRVAHAKIKRETGKKDPPEAALAQIPGKSSTCLANLQILTKCGAGGSLYAVVRPEHLA